MSGRYAVPRLWRYEIDEVWGEPIKGIEVGKHIIDRWKGNGTWNVMNTKTMKFASGWHAKRLEEGRQVGNKWEPLAIAVPQEGRAT